MVLRSARTGHHSGTVVPMTKKGKRIVWTMGIIWVLFILILCSMGGGQAAFFFRVARACQFIARMFGEWGIQCETEYHRLMAQERMN